MPQQHALSINHERNGSTLFTQSGDNPLSFANEKGIEHLRKN